VRTPRSLVDPDGYWESVRVSTMVLVQRAGSSGPRSFEALAHPRWAGQIVIGDPLTSGTAFTWALSMEHQHGLGFFPSLRKNNVRIAGGNATVLQKVEGGEADVGVVLLENVLAAQKRGSAIEAVWPTDGAVVIPGPAAIVSSSRNKAAARAVIDILLSPEGQRLLSQAGEMHVVDPREGGPHGLEGIEALLAKSAPLTDALLDRGVLGADEFKARFTSTFSQ
jgi:iron(III) transport system substrate-binding protein